MADYPVAGYPYLQTARPQGDAAQLEAGDVDVRDVDPKLLKDLEEVGEQLGEKLTIVSGYRTDSYSIQVGGFAGDPHTRGIAADVYVGSRPIGSVPDALQDAEAVGLVSGAQPGFYNGKPDPEHVQLPGTGPTSPSSGVSAAGTPVSLLAQPQGTTEAILIRLGLFVAGGALLVLAFVLLSKAATGHSVVSFGAGLLAGRELPGGRRRAPSAPPPRTSARERGELGTPPRLRPRRREREGA